MKFKKLLSLVLVFILSFSFVFFLPLNSVSADSFSYNLPESWFSSGSDQPALQSYINLLKSNSNFTSLSDSSSYVFLKPQSSGFNVYVWSVPTDQYYGSFRPVASSSTGYMFFSSDLYFGYASSSSDLSSITFTHYTQLLSDRSSRFAYLPSSNSFGIYDACLTPSFTAVSSSGVCSCMFYFTPGFTPDSNSYQLTGFLIGSDTSMEAFYNWIIDNNKLSELPSYIVSSKLKSLIDFYHNYGGSLTSFIHYLPQWLSYVSLPSQTQENANILKNKLDALYSEFINQYIVTVTRDRSQQLAHHRYGIHTVTDDSDTSLITDDVNDDTVTSILRDILRGVIQITNSIYENTSALIEKIDSINFTATVVNNGGVPSGTDINPLLHKMDDIIEALQADTVSVEIDQTTQDDTDQFLSDWADEFSVELDSKFPVINQLGTLFSDDFFEKCGIDTDGDGEVFEYYNPELALSRSAPAGSESGIVSDFLNQFDDSDPAFLDNVSFSESVPDWSVSIAGTKASVFSFKLYAKYRTWIHTIISFIIWTCFLLGLYKSLPGLIGNVANTFDVSHDIFVSKSTTNNKG